MILAKTVRVQGLNLLNCVYHADGVSLPVTYALIRKPILFSDVKTRRVKRKSLHTKNELMRQMLRACQHNQIKYRYVLADSWFSAKDNLTFIHQTLQKHFVVALKSNRTVALSYEQKRQGAFTRIDSCQLPEHQPVQAGSKDWISPSYYSGRSLHTKMAAPARCICLQRSNL